MVPGMIKNHKMANVNSLGCAPGRKAHDIRSKTCGPSVFQNSDYPVYHLLSSEGGQDKHKRTISSTKCEYSP